MRSIYLEYTFSSICLFVLELISGCSLFMGGMGGANSPAGIYVRILVFLMNFQFTFQGHQPFALGALVPTMEKIGDISLTTGGRGLPFQAKFAGNIWRSPLLN